MKKLCLYAVLLVGLLGGVAWAQIPGVQADTLPDGYFRKHLALPTEIRQLLDDNKAKEAVAEYEKFKKTAQTDPLEMLFLDAEVYGTAASIEPSAAYGKMRDEAVRQMVEKYPDNAEAIMRTLPADGNMNMDMDKTLEILNKAIKADPEYLPAYEQRFYIYRQKNMAKEACMDYMKLPESIRAGVGMMMWDCEALTKDAEKK